MTSQANILPTLYHKARSGAVHSWQVETDGPVIISTHGQVTGQKIVSKKIATPKNVGRSNETSAEAQAVLEAEAMHLFKLSRKYSLTPDEAKEDVLLPMLAQAFEKRESNLTYPLDVQPKLDGVRALARWEGDKVVLISRSGKPWLVTTHINEQLERIMPKGTVLDGEIYLHGKGFQWITARTKKRQPGTELLEFNIYDIPEHEGDDSLTWDERKRVLDKLIKGNSGPLRSVLTVTVFNRAELDQWHDDWVTQGYEGLIARVLSAPYEYGHRSPSLLKVKAFQDSEFTIVGYGHGDGIEHDLVIWHCENDTNNLTFETRPRGTHDERRELYRTADDYVGATLTCRFFGRTDLGLPRFPIGVGIRAEEDQ